MAGSVEEMPPVKDYSIDELFESKYRLPHEYPVLLRSATLPQVFSMLRPMDWIKIAGVSAIVFPVGYFTGVKTGIRTKLGFLGVQTTFLAALYNRMVVSYARLEGRAENEREARVLRKRAASMGLKA